MSLRDRLERYIRENPGAPYIIAFQGMLLVCAGLLMADAEASANEVAVYAFYTLVIGVLLQLITYMMRGWRRGRKSATKGGENTAQDDQ